MDRMKEHSPTIVEQVVFVVCQVRGSHDFLGPLGQSRAYTRRYSMARNVA